MRDWQQNRNWIKAHSVLNRWVILITCHFDQTLAQTHILLLGFCYINLYCCVITLYSPTVTNATDHRLAIKLELQFPNYFTNNSAKSWKAFLDRSLFQWEEKILNGKLVSITHFYKIVRISMWPFINQKLLIQAENPHFMQLSCISYIMLLFNFPACDAFSLSAPYHLAFNFTFN